jgi:CPA2 family monovalent cation:H+ antiporter-2
MMTAKGNSYMGGQRLHLVLGCGDVGFEVASRLKERGMAVAVVEKDAGKVKELRLAAGHDVYLGDFRRPEVLKQAGISRADAVILTVPDFATIRQALKAINSLKKELGINPAVIVRVVHEIEAEEAKRLGASDVVPSAQTIADALVDKIKPKKQKAS